MTQSSLFTDFSGDEPSSLTAFAGNVLDRAAEHRADDCLETALAQPEAKLFGFVGSRVLLDGANRVQFALSELSELLPDPASAILLGFDRDGVPHLAMPLNHDPDTLPEGFRIEEGRELYRAQLLDDETLGAFAQAASLLTWNRQNRFCGKCSGGMESKAGGYKRVCSACGHMIFPRTDPVVIMLTVDEERDLCLLGRGAHFPPGMYSCLAGFLEPGETIENAVRRETLEESGISVGAVRYHASQPWPMPHSLMIGCFAKATSFDIQRDETELEDCRWFTRAETEAMLSQASADGRTSPPKGAIAHRLMRDWLAKG